MRTHFRLVSLSLLQYCRRKRTSFEHQDVAYERKKELGLAAAADLTAKMQQLQFESASAAKWLTLIRAPVRSLSILHPTYDVGISNKAHTY